MKNVYEAWPLYDTVLVGTNQSQKGTGWFETFNAMGLQDEIPFFNQRNQSGTHPAYNNFDSQEHLPFAYHCYSIGVEFFGMPFSDFGIWNVGGYWEMQANTENYLKFCSELVQHAGLTLKVSQDIKLETTCAAAPAGAGIAGFTRKLYTGGNPVALGTFQNVCNGVPHITNRWKFHTPIQMPRAVNVSATIKFSELGRDLLQAMDGPGVFRNAPVDTADSINACAGIRISMFGKREVQQRGQLSFSA